MTTSTTDAMDSVLLRLHAALKALTAPGATTKSAEGFLSSLPSGESEPVVTPAWSPSDPSSTRSDVTVDDLVDVMIDAGLLFDDEHEAARALLDQFEIRRK